MGGASGIGHHEATGGASIDKKQVLILALGAASLAILVKVGDGETASAVPAATVVTRCAVVETSSVDGFASNQSSEPLKLFGELRFRFTIGGAPSRPDRLVQADADLPLGKPVQVARVRLDPPLREGEQCVLDLENAVRPRR